MTLVELLESKERRRNELAERAKTTEDIKELRNINIELGTINAEIESLRSIINEQSKAPEEPPLDARNKDANSANSAFNPVNTYFTGTQKRNEETDDMYDSLEYRSAFKDYVTKGIDLASKFTQQRANSLTTVNDVGAVIPTVLQNRVIQDLQEVSKILPRITQISVKGGIDIPMADINFEAKWLDSEETVSDEQKAEINAKLNFKYHVLECRVAVGFLTDVVALSVFENAFVERLKLSMTNAIEAAIINGTGVGQPLGFLKHNLPAEQIVTMTEENIGKVTTWAGVESLIPEIEEDRVIYIMAKATWEKYLNGMVATDGQRIGLGKINEKGQKILNGREVLTVHNLPSFDKAGTGDIFGVVIDLKQYLINTNFAMYYKKYFNEDKNKWTHKAIMIVDGKMMISEVENKSGTKKLVGAKGLIYLKK